MIETLAITIFIVTFSVSVGWANLEIRLRVESELKRKGVVNHIEQIWVVKGLPGIKEGSKVSLFHYQDRVTVNDNIVIPLNRIKTAETFRINEVRMTDKLAASDRNILSIEFIDKQGNDCNTLFIAGNRRSIKSFADGINRQIETFSEKRSLHAKTIT